MVVSKIENIALGGENGEDTTMSYTLLQNHELYSTLL